MITIKELAQKIQKSDKTVRRWIKSNTIAAVRIGRDWRISENEVDRIITCGVSLDRYSLVVTKKKPARRKEGIRPWEQ